MLICQPIRCMFSHAYEDISGGYCGGVPPLPIPNREVKPACADGTAMQCGRVGGRHLFLGSPDSSMSQGFFVFPGFWIQWDSRLARWSRAPRLTRLSRFSGITGDLGLAVDSSRAGAKVLHSVACFVRRIPSSPQSPQIVVFQTNIQVIWD